MTKIKTCTKCKSTKPINHFGIDKKRKDGRNPWCKLCNNLRQRVYAKTHRKQIVERNKAWKKKNPARPCISKEASRKAFSKWHKKNKTLHEERRNPIDDRIKRARIRVDKAIKFLDDNSRNYNSQTERAIIRLNKATAYLNYLLEEKRHRLGILKKLTKKKENSEKKRTNTQ